LGEFANETAIYFSHLSMPEVIWEQQVGWHENTSKKLYLLDVVILVQTQILTLILLTSELSSESYVLDNELTLVGGKQNITDLF
jgi:hypothetical protein